MKRYTDFMCICGDEPRKKSEDCLARVLEYLSTDKNKVDRGTLLTSVVYGLQWSLGEEFVGTINGIGCDQWCGVSADVMKSNESTNKYEDYAHIYVQCDEVEHGIARVWELAKEAVADARAQLSDWR